MSRNTQWSQTAADNDDPAKGGWKENMNRSDVNNQARDNLAAHRTWIEDGEWVNLLEEDGDDFTVSRLSTTQFGVTDGTGTNAISKFPLNRWIQVAGTGGSTLVYGFVSARSYSDPLLTVTLSGIIDASYASSDLPSSTVTQVDCYLNSRVRAAAFHPTGTTLTQSPAQIPTIDDLGDSATVDQGTGNGLDADTVDGFEALDLGVDGLTNRNALINGAMNVWQRGPDHTNVADQSYAADRWKVLMETTALWDCDREDSLAPDGFRHSLKLQANGTTNTKVAIFQVISGENSAEIIGNGKASLSFRLLLPTATGFSGVRAAILEWTGAEDAQQNTWISTWGAADSDPTPVASWNIANTPSADEAAASDDWQEITIENITISSSATNLAVSIWLDDKSFTNLDAWYVSGVQLVPGATATKFVYPRFEDEWLRCRPYYTKTFDYSVTPEQASLSFVGVLESRGATTTGQWADRWEFGVHSFSVGGAGLYVGATTTFYSPKEASAVPYNVAADADYGGGVVVFSGGASSVTMYGTGAAAADEGDRLQVHCAVEAEF